MEELLRLEEESNLRYLKRLYKAYAVEVAKDEKDDAKIKDILNLIAEVKENLTAEEEKALKKAEEKLEKEKNGGFWKNLATKDRIELIIAGLGFLGTASGAVCGVVTQIEKNRIAKYEVDSYTNNMVLVAGMEKKEAFYNTSTKEAMKRAFGNKK